MGANASTSVSAFTPFKSLAAVAAVGFGALLFTAGCGHKQAAEAQSPPPQTLSEPVRPVEVAPSAPPALPASVDNQYAAQQPGETRSLPTFEAPPPPASAPSLAPASLAVNAPGDQRDEKGRYHVLQKGETLYAVSRNYNVKPKRVIDANQFRDPNHLSVGTKVYIPD